MAKTKQQARLEAEAAASFPGTSSSTAQPPRKKARTLPKSFVYRKLDPMNQEIRLLVINKLDGDNGWEFRLTHESLIDQPDYTALSYCWGETLPAKHILLDGSVFEVRSNLYSALSQLAIAGYRKLWIDAICINQQDNAERAEQIPRMRSIYYKAKQVVTWLGDSDPNTSKAVALIEQLATRKLGIGSNILPDDVLHSIMEVSMGADDWKCLELLFRNDYWSRVWIIQEIAFGKQCRIHWGQWTTTWDHVRAAIATCCAYVKIKSEANSSSRRNKSSTSDSMALVKYGQPTADISTLECLVRLLNQCGCISALDEFCSDIASGKPIDFFDALTRSSRSHATDRRDKAFSILGLTHNGFDYIPLPNYTQTPDELCIEITSAVLKKQESVEFLSYAWQYRPEGKFTLPSWCLDWFNFPTESFGKPLGRASNNENPSIYFRGDTILRKYLVSSGPSSVTISGRSLEVRVECVDIVAGTSSLGQEAVASAATRQTLPGGISLDQENINTEDAAAPNPYGSDIEALKAILQSFTIYGDIDLKEKIENISLSRYVESYAYVDLVAFTDLVESTFLRHRLWVKSLQELKFQGSTFKDWWKLHPRLYFNGPPNSRSKTGLFTRRVYMGGNNLDPDDSIRISNKIGAEMDNVLGKGARLITTQLGRIGWGHQDCQKGDFIVMIAGCSEPVIIRHLRDATGEPYIIVGDAYVYGLLDGRSTKALDEKSLQTIKLQ